VSKLLEIKAVLDITIKNTTPEAERLFSDINVFHSMPVMIIESFLKAKEPRIDTTKKILCT